MHKRFDGFTIVELLIVIVVIAILASVTVVGYNGISERARMSIALAFAKQLDRIYGQNKLSSMSFEDGVGNGNSPQPTDDSGSNISRFINAPLRTIASTELPTGNYVYDFSLGGGNAYIRNYPGSTFPTTNLIISFWFKHGSNTSNNDGHVLVCFDCDTASQHTIKMGSRNTGYRAEYQPTAASPLVVFQTPAYNLTKWHHVALQFDGTTSQARLYFDGKKAGETASVPISWADGGPYYDIGRGISNDNYGQIDDFRIYSYD